MLWTPPENEESGIVKSTLEALKARAYRLRSLEQFYKWSILGGLTGISGGLAASAFVWLLGASGKAVSGIARTLPATWLVALIPCLGGIAVGALKTWLSPETFESSSSTDRAIDAVHQTGGHLPRRTPVVTALTSTITLSTGGSAGREGPTVLIGAGVGSLVAELVDRLGLHRRLGFRFSEEDVRVLAICGMAAGLGAVFRAPIGAALFAIGVLYVYGMDADHLAPTLVSSLTAYIVFSLFYGFEPMFRAPFTWDIDLFDIAMVLLIGVVSSLAGMAYIRVFYGLFRRFRRWRAPEWLKPAIGGLAVGVIGLAMPRVLGIGHETIQDMIDYRIGAWALVLLAVAKMLATSLTIGSGGAGGDMAPALFIGAAIGGAIGSAATSLFPDMAAHPALYVIAGMGAVYSSVSKVPLATAILLCESTRNYTLILPLVIADIAASLVSGDQTIYESQLASATREQQDVLRRVPVAQICTTEPVTVRETTSALDLLRLVGSSGHHGFPVLDADGKLVGVVGWTDAQKVPYNERERTLVAAIMSQPALTVTLDEPARRALDLIERHKVGRIVVVSFADPREVIGVVTKEDLIKAYVGRVPADPRR